MSKISDHHHSVPPIPNIPSRRERRALAKRRGIFKKPGMWKQVNDYANNQRNAAIQQAISTQLKKRNMIRKDSDVEL